MPLGVPAQPAGRAREEDHALGVARDVGEVAHHPRLAPAARGRRRHRRPHAELELAPELLDEPLLVLAHARIALGEQDLAVPGLHAQEPHASEYARDRACAATVRARARLDGAAVALARRPITSTGPGPAPSSRSPSRTAATRRPSRPAPPRAASSPSARRAASVDGVRAARAVRGAVGVALAGQLDDLLAVAEDVGRDLAVPAGERRRPAGRARAPRARAPAPSSRVRRPSARAPRARSASRRWRAGGQRAQRVLGAAARAAARPTRRPSPGRRRPASPASSRSSASTTASIVARVGEHPELDGVDAEVLGDGAHLRDDHRGRDRLDRASRRRCSAP